MKPKQIGDVITQPSAFPSTPAPGGTAQMATLSMSAKEVASPSTWPRKSVQYRKWIRADSWRTSACVQKGRNSHDHASSSCSERGGFGSGALEWVADRSAQWLFRRTRCRSRQRRQDAARAHQSRPFYDGFHRGKQIGLANQVRPCNSANANSRTVQDWTKSSVTSEPLSDRMEADPFQCDSAPWRLSRIDFRPSD